jgi:nicotinamide-nucleotide amidase
MQKTKASILVVGDELLTGQKVESNSNYISEVLLGEGIKVENILTVGDTSEDIKKALEFLAKSKSSLIIVTGGLGPTIDDKTKTAISSHFNLKMTLNYDVYKDLADRYGTKGGVLPESLERQALQPENALLIKNEIGSAYGFIIKDSGKFIIALPGVPREMKDMMSNFVLTFLHQVDLVSTRPQTEEIRVVGMKEAEVVEALKPLEEEFGGKRYFFMAYYPHGIDVSVRLISEDPDKEKAEELFDFIKKRARSLLGENLYTYGKMDMAEVISRMMKNRGLTLAVAESCTGGGVVKRIVNIPGASDFLLGSAVVYSNQSKVKLLSVSEETLKETGAVSPQTAEEMARGARELYGADIAISTTGIAGPGGGTEEKPVGLVYVGYADDSEVLSEEFNLEGDRDMLIRKASQMALNLLRLRLLDK